MGNHERMMLDFLASPPEGAVWLANGGVETLHSYGVGLERWGARHAETLAAAAAQLDAALPDAHRRFLAGLRLLHREGDALFVHAGIRPGVALAEQAEDDLLWIRGAFLDSDADHGVVVVHGHTPSRKPELRGNRIGIDTGACYGGALTAVGMDSAGVRVLRARA
jgi:serine/threonine protein phosphatase 1